MTTWNKGVLEGLKMAKTLVQREVFECEGDERSRLVNILLELLKLIDLEEDNIKKQEDQESIRSLMFEKLCK